MKLQTVRFKSGVILLLRYLVMSLKHNCNWLEFTHVLTYFATGRMESFMVVLFSTFHPGVRIM